MHLSIKQQPIFPFPSSHGLTIYARFSLSIAPCVPLDPSYGLLMLTVQPFEKIALLLSHLPPPGPFCLFWYVMLTEQGPLSWT